MTSRNTLFCVLVLLGSCAAVRGTLAQDARPQADRFAEIGAIKSDYTDRNLVEMPPPALDRRMLPLDANPTAETFRLSPKITTVEQLAAELRRQRDLHAPFLKDLAPPLEDARLRVPLESFEWRVETEQDRTDFAGTLAGQGRWQQVKIPHYGPPMGRAATYYRTSFDVSPAMLAKGSLFVCFKGVDYRAHVFLNGALLGSHEGVFAPFEFEFMSHARPGKNCLLVKVENDFIMMGNDAEKGFVGGEELQGSKVYAAVGPNWDEPEVGWHHCPPGMGIYQEVTIEARPRIHFHDIFVRPLPQKGKAEVWIELFGCDYRPERIALELSVHGQNFAAAPLVVPKADVSGALQPVGRGVNLFQIPLAVPQPRPWNPEMPWLYQIQAKLHDQQGKVVDTMKRQFGLRSFRMEYVDEPKGRMYLNGQGVKLRGANTMGALQQCVMRKDWRQLIDDILLAKITHMNYLRLTQMPVQPEVYDYCDRLGLMVQTDLPTFGCIKRSQFGEVVRQAGEMERLVRSHPSNIMVTYINEPFANALGAPHRNLTREEMTRVFESADMAVRMANPDRVIKAVDGDYDPPGPGMPDNHCYCGWYNGHGVDLGMLHKGFWQRVKPGWVYGCGEFGSEGLDRVELMRKYYPKSWLPQTADQEKQWSPDKIVGAQTGQMHHNFFETPQTLAGWVEGGQSHQAWATRLMTEAFRRDRRMHSFAIHLFIDAFPSGWMKSIMDCDRQPKPAWFAYQDALAPLAVSLRTDRRAFFADEPIELEAWVCNDGNHVPADAKLHYQMECDGAVLQSGSSAAAIAPLDSTCQGTVRFQSPKVERRVTVTVRLGLLDAGGKMLHDTAVVLDVCPRKPADLRRLYVIGKADGKAARLAKGLGAKPVLNGPIKSNDAILIDDMQAFSEVQVEVAEAVRGGARAVFLELPGGKHRIGGTEVAVGGTPTGLHFVSRATGHPLVQGFQPEDFKFWYDARCDRVTPLLNTPAFTAAGWEPILSSHNALAAGWKADGKGHWCICQMELAGRTAGNAVATIFAQRLLAANLPAEVK
jgi:hypothetical protein